MDAAILIVAFLAAFILMKLVYFDARKHARLARETLERDGRLPMRQLARLSPSRRAKVYHEMLRPLLLDDDYVNARVVVDLLAGIDEEGALNWQIDLALHAGDDEAIVGLCRRALEFHEENVAVRVALVESLLSLEQVEDALEVAEWAEENRDPDLLRAYGAALEAAGESDSAQIAYQEADRAEEERARAQRALEHGIGA